jgi:hypothetical protein
MAPTVGIPKTISTRTIEGQFLHNRASATEAEFERELEIFRQDAEEAAQYFSAHCAMHNLAGSLKPVLAYLNRRPMFWVTCSGALQSAAIISLGRIMDNDSPHNINRLIRMLNDSPQIFDRPALLARKSKGWSDTRPGPKSDLLEEFVASAYVPRTGELRKFRKTVRRYVKIYEAKYKRIRDEWIAHRVLGDAMEAFPIFALTKAGELQRILAFLLTVHETLWQTFNNGRRLRLPAIRYSVQNMRRQPSIPARSASEKIVHEVEMVLVDAARVKPTKLAWALQKKELSEGNAKRARR